MYYDVKNSVFSTVLLFMHIYMVEAQADINLRISTFVHTLYLILLGVTSLFIVQYRLNESSFWNCWINGRRLL